MSALADLDSLQTAEATMILRRELPSEWGIVEVDGDDDRHISADQLAVGFGAIQCALAAIAIWLQVREGRRLSELEYSRAIAETVKRTAKALDADLGSGEIEAITRGLDQSIREPIVIVRQYRLAIKVDEGLYVIRGIGNEGHD